jgi:hypothetical protein
MKPEEPGLRHQSREARDQINAEPQLARKQTKKAVLKL